MQLELLRPFYITKNSSVNHVFTSSQISKMFFELWRYRQNSLSSWQTFLLGIEMTFCLYQWAQLTCYQSIMFSNWLNITLQKVVIPPLLVLFHKRFSFLWETADKGSKYVSKIYLPKLYSTKCYLVIMPECFYSIILLLRLLLEYQCKTDTVRCFVQLKLLSASVPTIFKSDGLWLLYVLTLR